ncbi:MAG: SRPBCC family protein [Actinomycetota bacterium]|jgi:hypothetical protein|nr:SRPBCC family protein [Actinomycetota bacterium]MDA3027644.1 SRPBCC family protein [Actinomycetota bacterium]
MAFALSTTERITAAPDVAIGALRDLAGYGRWVSIIGDVVRDGPDAWLVELRADLGPLRRSKRLRMVRLDAESSQSIRFSRSELDGRRHANWELRLAVEPNSDESLISVELDYDGRVPLGPFESLVKAEVSAAARRLESILSAEPER